MKKIQYKKIFIILLSVIMVVTSIPFTATAATTNDDGYIEIRTIEELYNVRDDLTANYILMNDIDLTEATAEGGDWDFMGNGWNPIGSNDVYGNSTFSGIFDGNGHTISGMRIDVTNIPSGADKVLYVGLFAEVSGKVLDLKIENTSICAEATSTENIYIGTVAARTTGGEISGCSIVGEIISKHGINSYVGGLIGYNQASIIKSDVKMSLDVSTRKEMFGTANVGGIVGYNLEEIQCCYVDGVIKGYGEGSNISNTDYSYSYVGGVAGYNHESLINNCYNLASVEAKTYEASRERAGGICGMCVGGYVENCYNRGLVKAKAPSNAKAVTNVSVENCFYLQGTGIGCAGATSLTESQMLLQSMYKGLDFDAIWMMDVDAEYSYPQLIDNIQDDRVFKEMIISSLPNKVNYEQWEELDLTGCVLEVRYFNADTKHVDVTKEMVTGFDSNVAGDKVLTITYGKHMVDFTISVNEKEYKEIYTAMDLYNVRYDLDGNYILMSDIDLTDATAVGGAWDFDGRGWNPIGSEDVYDTSEFRGIFNGNSHTITGMRINVTNVPDGTPQCPRVGLFAYVSGTVKNLTMQDVDINISVGRAFALGTIAAQVASGGRIENCSVKGTVVGSGGNYSSSASSSLAVGGISGRSSGVISNCKADVSVSSKSYGNGYYTTSNVGAITGENSGIIQYCYTGGNVEACGGTYSASSGTARAGGVSGTNSGSIVDSYNSAKVQAPSAYSSTYAYAGGISAKSQEELISNCYNIGVVSAVSAGHAYGIANTKVINCYYLNGTVINTSGATALTEKQLRLQDMFEGFDFDKVWHIDKNANYPYPQLISNPCDVRVIKEAKIYSLPDKMTYVKWEELDVTGMMLVFEYENAEHEYVSVTNDMVMGFDANVIGKQMLQVTYHNKEFQFEIVVNEKPFLPIYTVEDLYNIRKDLTANYMLMNDIDLTSATAEGGDWDYDGRGWNPIGSNDVYGKSAFSGIFDGKGHSIIGMRIDASRYPSGSGSAVYVGLFSYVTGKIRNLQMKNINIEKAAYNSDYYNMHFYVGGITGHNSGVISTCRTSGNINATQGVKSEHVEMYVGGIGGYNDGTISQSYNNVDVSSWWYAGGVAGYNTEVIENCYNNGKIDSVGCYKSTYSSYGYPYAGGIASQNSGAIVNCYNIGLVSAVNSANAYAIAYGSNIDSSYYMSGVGVGVTGATVLTETQMKLEAMYEGFDFENVWVLNSSANYPYAQLRENAQELSETVELIRVIAYPIKTEYLTDDVIDPIGGMFEAVYISSKTELLEITADMISGYDPKVIGEQTLTVTYGGQTDTFTINVSRRPEVTSIELAGGPIQKEFVIGTAFDFTGAQIKVFYDNDTSEIIDVTNEMTTGGNINHISSQTIIVNCGGQTVTFDVKVIPASISRIEITKLPSKLEYMEGKEFDATGMVVMATYSNGSTVQVKSGYKVTGYSSEPGIHKVTIEFAGEKATFDVTVNERVLLNLEIKAKPDKLNYVVGEELDLTGLLVVAAYENGDLDIIEDYTVSGLDGKAGSKVITITYKGKTTSFVVNVAVKCVGKIEIIKMPTKLSYIENEALNVEGMIVKATYNDGEIKTITDYKLEGYSSLPGVHSVYVSYEGQVDSFDVNVTEKVLSDLKVTIPAKTTYEIGETFDATGMVVTAYYNNGQQYSVDNYVMSEFDSNSAGAKEIKITYEGMTRSFVVTVVEKTPIATGGKIEVGTGKVRLGETISVPVTITKNTGLSAFCHTITFDANDLAFKKVNLQGGFANGTVIINNEKVASGEITVLWFQANNVMESGVAYTLEFEVLETATDGISDITIAFDANENGNASGENVLFEAVNGSVEVLSYWLGDLNGDRKYAMADLLQLAQYVSGQTMTLNDKQKLSADVNEDGIIDIHDVTLLSQWLLEADM